MTNKAIILIDKNSWHPDAQTSESPTAPSQVFPTTTTEQPSGTDAAEVNKDSEAETNTGREGVEDGAQAELETIGQRNSEPEIAETQGRALQS